MGHLTACILNGRTKVRRYPRECIRDSWDSIVTRRGASHAGAGASSPISIMCIICIICIICIMCIRGTAAYIRWGHRCSRNGQVLHCTTYIISACQAQGRPIYSLLAVSKWHRHSVHASIHGRTPRAMFSDRMARWKPCSGRKGKEGLPFTRSRGLLAYWRGPSTEDTRRLLGRESPHLRGR